MSKRSPGLQFTDEERSSPELEKVIRKADKAADKLDKAEAKIPKKTVKRKERVVGEDGKVTVSVQEYLHPMFAPVTWYSLRALMIPRELPMWAYMSATT